MTTNNTSSMEQAAPSLGPGDRLQAARIAVGLTLGDVANRMHLSETILSSLEENNFEDITAPIFVKGYLRAYARIVNVDENDIIQQYNSFYTDGDPPISSTSNTSPEINADDTRVKWVTWLIILALIALLTTWWWNRYQQPAQPLSLDSMQPRDEDRPSAIVAAPDSAPVDSGDEVQELSQQAQTALQNLGDESPAAESDAPTSTDVAEDPLPSNLPQPLTIEMAPVEPAVEPAIPEIESQPALESDTPPVVERSEADAESASPGLTIVVNADTWASITDADGKRLVRDLLRAGETLTLTGRPPLNVFLGNGYGVSLRYNGEDIDISNRIRDNNTARVSIGP